MSGDNIIHWRDLDVPTTVDADNYAYQKQATYALLFADRFFQGEFQSDDSGHAEQNLLASPAWVNLVNRLVADGQNKRPPRYRRILLVINRTPCHGMRGGCTGRLVQALLDVRRRLGGERFFLTEFVLAATGIYEKGGDLLGRTGKDKNQPLHDERTGLLRERYDQGCTTDFDCYALMNAGWRLKALQVGKTLSSRGNILQSFIQSADTRMAQPRSRFRELVDRYTYQGQPPPLVSAKR